MTIFGEPISLWISIIALLISLLSLFISRRKQEFDERTVLAKYIEEMKITFGKGARVCNAILAELDKQEKNGKDDSIELIHQSQAAITKLKSEYEELYNQLGRRNIKKTPDPVLLASMSVDNKTGIDNLEIMKSAIKKSDS
jgi:hypothetical protein